MRLRRGLWMDETAAEQAPLGRSKELVEGLVRLVNSLRVSASAMHLRSPKAAEQTQVFARVVQYRQ